MFTGQGVKEPACERTAIFPRPYKKSLLKIHTVRLTLCEVL